MSRYSTKNRHGGWTSRHGSAGSDSYNPGNNDYDQKFDFNNVISNSLNTAEIQGNNFAQHNASSQQYLRQSETTPLTSTQNSIASSSSLQTRQPSGSGRSNDILRNFFNAKNLRKRSSLMTILLLLFGGGSMLAAFFSPSLAIVQMKEVFTKGLNDQLRAVDERSSVLIRSKLKDVTKGSCGAVKIKCRYATMTEKQIKKYERNNSGLKFNTVPLDEGGGQSGLFKNRYQISSISFTDEVGKTIDIKDPGLLQKELINNVQFRAAMTKAYNPLFASLSDKVALNVMRSLKTSKRLVATGKTDAERQKNINAAVSGIEDSGARTVVKTTDKDGKEIYTDSEGNPIDSSQVTSAEQQAARGEEYLKNGGMKSVLSGAVKGVSIVGYMDSACTVYNSMRFVSALSKVKKQAQASRFAMAMVLSPADSIKSGNANPDDVAFVGNNLTSVQLASSAKVLDESKISMPGTAAKPPLKNDPDSNKNAFDSPGYQLAAYDTVPDINLRASRFMLAGGSTALLNGVLGGVATIVNGGDSNPKAVSQKCRYIQNPAVRFTGLAIGIIAGIGSFGLTTLASIGGSMAIAMALPYIESQGADIVAGNLFKDISGIDSGDAAYVGAAGLFGSMAMNRGMKPLSREEGVKYLAANQASYNNYSATQKYLARATPFDITNQFSFMGSIARSIVPVAQRSKSSASMAMINIASMFPVSLSMLTNTARAASPDTGLADQGPSEDYFNHCNDPAYKSIGIDAGPFCEVRYGMSEQELAIDPLENAQWMADTGNIDPESETGDAKDNGQPWNYVKFLEQCAHRTVGWGEDQSENEGDGSSCIDPANESLNSHFRVYTMDQSIDVSMDGEDDTTSQPGTAGFTNGVSGEINSNGWAFPTVQTDTILKNYQSVGYPGVAIGAANDFQTQGQSIFATYAGKVIAAGPSSQYGNWIVIEHQIGNKIMTSVYARMNQEGVLVKTGDTIAAGQQIGYIGSADNDSARPYLYFELWEGRALGDGTRIDPTPYLNAARTKSGAQNV